MRACQGGARAFEMVRIQVKHGSGDEQREFLYECQSTCSIDEIARDLTEISNLQFQIQRCALQLQPHFSLHHDDLQVMTLTRALSEANSYASKDQVLHNKPLLTYTLKDHVKSIEREFKVNYHSLGFPDSNLQQLLKDLELLQEDTVELLWAGRKLVRGKLLCDYIGKNEKTKIILRLQSPVSDPAFNSKMDLSKE